MPLRARCVVLAHLQEAVQLAVLEGARVGLDKPLKRHARPRGVHRAHAPHVPQDAKATVRRMMSQHFALTLSSISCPASDSLGSLPLVCELGEKNTQSFAFPLPAAGSWTKCHSEASLSLSRLTQRNMPDDVYSTWIPDLDEISTCSAFVGFPPQRNPAKSHASWKPSCLCAWRAIATSCEETRGRFLKLTMLSAGKRWTKPRNVRRWRLNSAVTMPLVQALWKGLPVQIFFHVPHFSIAKASEQGTSEILGSSLCSLSQALTHGDMQNVTRGFESFGSEVS